MIYKNIQEAIIEPRAAGNPKDGICICSHDLTKDKTSNTDDCKDLN
jgi:hypothetical protein